MLVLIIIFVCCALIETWITWLTTLSYMVSESRAERWTYSFQSPFHLLTAPSQHLVVLLGRRCGRSTRYYPHFSWRQEEIPESYWYIRQTFQGEEEHNLWTSTVQPAKITSGRISRQFYYRSSQTCRELWVWWNERRVYSWSLSSWNMGLRPLRVATARIRTHSRQSQTVHSPMRIS